MNNNPESNPTPQEALNQSSELDPGNLQTPHFFGRTDWLSFGLTTVLVLGAYLFTLAPDVTLDSSGILSVGAMYAGVPHPPGFPVWTIYAHLFTLLPFSNVAWRVALSSAVAGALTSGGIALMVSRGGTLLVEAISLPAKIRLEELRALRVVSSCVAGMAFGFDGAFWRAAINADPWPFSLLLLAVVLCLLMRWVQTPCRWRYLYGASFVYGLTLTNSQILLAAALGLQFVVMFGYPKLIRETCMANAVLFMAGLAAERAGYLETISVHEGEVNILRVVFFLVGVGSTVTCIVLIVQTRRLFTEWKTIQICGVLFLLGLLAYIYEPIASMTNPPVNWAYARTADGFIHLLTRGQYEKLQPTAQLARFLEQLQTCADVTLTKFGLLYVLVALIPFCNLRRLTTLGRQWMFGLLAVYFSLAFFLPIVLNPSHDRSSREFFMVGYSASHLVLAICTGYGLVTLGVLFARRTA